MEENMLGKDSLKVDFIGIGIRKSATTWIAKCLGEHPQICFSSKKEIHFFDKLFNFRKGIKFYKKFFSHCSPEKIKGEFSAPYIFNKRAPRLIYQTFPEAKIIACIRNPIERAFSSYRSEGIRGKGSLSVYKNFEEALKKRPALTENGFYYKHLKRYFDLFPRENILVLIYEDIEKDPVHFIQNIYRFLGVDDSFSPQQAQKRVGPTAKRKEEKARIPLLNSLLYKLANWLGKDNLLYDLLDALGIIALSQKFLEINKRELNGETEKREFPSLNPQTRKYLRNLYREDVRKLEKLLGRDLSFWK